MVSFFLIAYHLPFWPLCSGSALAATAGRYGLGLASERWGRRLLTAQHRANVAALGRWLNERAGRREALAVMVYSLGPSRRTSSSSPQRACGPSYLPALLLLGRCGRGRAPSGGAGSHGSTRASTTGEPGDSCSGAALTPDRPPAPALDQQVGQDRRPVHDDRPPMRRPVPHPVPRRP